MTTNTSLHDWTASICVDCAIWHANGDDSGFDEETAERVRKAVGIADNETVVVGDEDGFSWQSCDACNDTRGGDRFTATVLVHDVH